MANQKTIFKGGSASWLLVGSLIVSACSPDFKVTEMDSRFSQLSINTNQKVRANASRTSNQTSNLWTRCASENGLCSFSGTQQVRYGNNGTYVYKTPTSSINCSNTVFGDPLPTLEKYCDYTSSSLVVVPTPTPTPVAPTAATWTRCASENGVCSFSGSQQVRYGNNGTYFYKNATGSINCSNSIFEDPLPTLVKFCDYANIGTVVDVPASTATVAPSISNASIPLQASAAGFNKLIFSDDFNSLSTISPDGSGTYPWYNGIWYESPSPSHAFSVSNSVLRAKTLPADPHEAWLTTLNRGSGPSTLFNLGYFEARMKWNDVPDNFSAFWLESSERAIAGVNQFCEIDIFEAFQAGVFAGAVHDWNWPNETHNDNNWHPVNADMSQWHTYGALWTTDTITWYFDNQPLMSWPTPNICKTQQLFMIIGAQQRAHDNEVYLDVDWVHVYNK